MIDYTTFPPNRTVDEILNRLRLIKVASGYNTEPVIGAEVVTLDEIGDDSTKMPFVCVEVVSLSGIAQLFNSEDTNATLTEDAELRCVIWCYIEDEVSPRNAIMALVEDVLKSIWTDETLNDYAVGVDLEQVRIFAPAMSGSNISVAGVSVDVALQFPRGG